MLLHGRTVLAESNYGHHLKTQIVASCLYGIDIQEEAVRLCKSQLELALAADTGIDSRLPFTKALGDVPPGPDLSRRIVCGDSLAQPRLGQTLGLDETAGGGFDIVIGNPPYINMIRMDKIAGWRDAIRRRFHTAEGAFDAFVPFFELSCRSVRPGGVVSLIVPNKILSAEYAAKLRDFISREAAIVYFLDAADCRPFDAAVYPVAVQTVRTAARRGDAIHVYKAISAGSQLRVEERACYPARVLKSFPGGIWSPILESNNEVIARAISADMRFEDVCTVRQAASVDEAYKVFRPLLCEDTEANGKEYKPFLISGTIDRYKNLWGSRDTSYLKTRFARPVLILDRSRLSAQRLRQIQSPKIIISGQALYPKAFLDAGGSFASGIPTVLLYDSRLPLEYLCGLLNSALYRVIYRVCWGRWR